MNESEKEYQLKILDMAANLYLDKIATPTDENLIFMESNVDKIVWDMATEIYQQSGFKADFARVRDIVISRIEKMRYQIQLEAERKAVEEVKRLSELQEQTEQKSAEEAKRLSELKAEIFLKLRRILAEELRVDEEKVNFDSNITDYLRAHWTDRLLISVAIEQEFEIEIPDDEAKKIGLYGFNSCRIRELLDYIYQKINDTTKTE